MCAWNLGIKIISNIYDIAHTHINTKRHWVFLGFAEITYHCCAFWYFVMLQIKTWLEFFFMCLHFVVSLEILTCYNLYHKLSLTSPVIKWWAVQNLSLAMPMMALFVLCCDHVSGETKILRTKRRRRSKKWLRSVGLPEHRRWPQITTDHCRSPKHDCRSPVLDLSEHRRSP